jgi:hypothetical protein
MSDEFEVPEQFVEVYRTVDAMITGRTPVSSYEEMRRDLTPLLVKVSLGGVTYRTCLMLSCLQQFDMYAALVGKTPVPGWLQSNSLGGFLCPDHAWLWPDHYPRWGQLSPVDWPEGGSGLVCTRPCEWSSGPVSHRRLAKELWRSHTRDIGEIKAYEDYAASRDAEDETFDQAMCQRRRFPEE